MSTEYQELTSRTGPASSKKTELQGKIQALKAQISDLASATSTYEKEFLDRKESLPPYSRTLQDLVLSGFFFSYLLLTLFMIFQIYRTTGLVVASTAAFILGIFGVILAELVRRYA